MTYQEIREAANEQFLTLSKEEYDAIANPVRKALAVLADGRSKNLTKDYLNNHLPYRDAIQTIRQLTEGDRKNAGVSRMLAAHPDRSFEAIIGGKRTRALLFAIVLLAVHIAAVVMMFVSLFALNDGKLPFALSMIAAHFSTVFFIGFIRNGSLKKRLAYVNTTAWAENERKLLVTRQVYEKERDLLLPNASAEETGYISPLKRWANEKDEIKKHPEKGLTIKTYDPETGEAPTTEMLLAEAKRRYAALTDEEYEKRAAPIRGILTTNKVMGKDGYMNMTKTDQTAFAVNILQLSLDTEKTLDLPISESDLEAFGMSLDDLRKGNRKPFFRTFRKALIRTCIALLIAGALLGLGLWIEPYNRTPAVILFIISCPVILACVIWLLKLFLGLISGTAALNKGVKKLSDPSYWEAEIETEVERMIIRRENEIVNAQF